MSVPDPKPIQTGAAIEEPGLADAEADTDFDSLRALGVETTQNLSSDLWTDYNVHDPGVTILEQICYALTDLDYRTDLDVADLLTGEHGRIDFDRLALRPPEQVLPCRPSTVEDYRRAILDRVPLAENVWLEPLRQEEQQGFEGLYAITVRPRPGADRNGVCDAVRTAYRALRNLCEDAATVRPIEEVACTLEAEIEVIRWIEPAVILAEIYARCEAYLACEARVRPFEEARRDERPLDAILEGPLGERGFWDVRAAQGEGAAPSLVSELTTRIKGVEGVDHVRSLHLRLVDRPDTLPAPSALGSPIALRLEVPRTGSEIGVRLRTEGRDVPVPWVRFAAQLERRSYRGSEDAPRQDPSKLRDLPEGERRDLAAYVSIQNELPAAYGISERGMPGSAPLEAQGRALQLRGYLLLFDQLMANFAANIAALPDLFSVSLAGERSYSSQAISASRTPDVDRIYDVGENGAADDLVASALRAYDDFADRKGRLLDYLLALYGEEFTQRSLRIFDVYSVATERRRAILENKVAFLEAVVELGRDRGAGIRPGAGGPSQVSGLERRVSLLLGCGDRGRQVLTGPLVDEPEGDGSADLPGERHAALDALRVVVRAEIEDLTAVVPMPGAAGPEEERKAAALGRQFGDLLAMPDHPIGARLFAGGIALDRYALGRLGPESAWHLFFDLRADEQWCALGAFVDREEASRAANLLCSRLTRLNRACEGLHVVEHVLLRPAEDDAHHPQLSHDWYSLRATVLFPDWTARCENDGFRHLARETVVASCPAHVLPTILWLPPLEMREFERLHAVWLEQWERDDIHPAALDQASGPLAAFLARELEQRAGGPSDPRGRAEIGPDGAPAPGIDG